jgi:hypothetical protein
VLTAATPPLASASVAVVPRIPLLIDTCFSFSPVVLIHTGKRITHAIRDNFSVKKSVAFLPATRFCHSGLGRRPVAENTGGFYTVDVGPLSHARGSAGQADFRQAADRRAARGEPAACPPLGLGHTSVAVTCCLSQELMKAP